MIRAATIDDVDTIVDHRASMFRDMGHRDEAAIAAMSAALGPWLRRKMESGEYLAWFAIEDGRIVAGAGLWLMDWIPHMIGPGAPRANILNVYTHPDYRRRGLARLLVEISMNWCREHGIRAIILHASPEGRPLYEKLGFRPTNEMRVEITG